MEVCILFHPLGIVWTIEEQNKISLEQYIERRLIANSTLLS